jgi:hypothetical protein
MRGTPVGRQKPLVPQPFDREFFILAFRLGGLVAAIKRRPHGVADL